MTEILRGPLGMQRSTWPANDCIQDLNLMDMVAIQCAQNKVIHLSLSSLALIGEAPAPYSASLVNTGLGKHLSFCSWLHPVTQKSAVLLACMLYVQEMHSPLTQYLVIVPNHSQWKSFLPPPIAFITHFQWKTSWRYWG